MTSNFSNLSNWPKHLIGLALFLLTVVPSRTAGAQDFFAGRTITLSTHSEMGGGYDVYLRLLARHMGKHIPGNPQLTVINQPGGGGLTAVNHAANVAPQDGTFLTIVSHSVPVIEVTGGRGFQTSVAQFSLVGHFTRPN